MFSLVKTDGQWTAISDIDLLDPDTQEGMEFSACQGASVVICDTLEDFSDTFGIPISDIKEVN